MAALTNSTIQIVKQTAPVIAQHGTTITSTMYRNMFANHPVVKTYFNMQHQVPAKGDTVGAQPKSLAQAVLAYANNIDNLGALGPAVERIAEKHVSLFVKPEHYDIVGSELIGAIKEVLKDAATPDIVNAWTEAYQFLAKIFIDREQAMMKEKSVVEGGWLDMKEFTIKKLVPETPDISSFYLKPADGSPMLSTWKAGQYVGIRHNVDGEDVQRNYSISCPPGSDEIRLTIKKETANGEFTTQLVSRELHKLKENDTVKISVPCGHFTLAEPKNENPLVFVSLGVGVTPIIPMATEAAGKYQNPITIIQGAHNEKSLCFSEEYKKLAEANASKVTYKEAVRHPEQANGTAVTVTPEWIWENSPADACFYFTGPSEWMQSVATFLREKGVPEENINFEFFGPTLQL